MTTPVSQWAKTKARAPRAAPRDGGPRRVKAMTPGIPRAARVRAYSVAGLMILGLAGMGYEAWGLQVGSGAKWGDKAKAQHERMLEVPAPRGAIVDSRGRPLAVTADADSIFVDPHDVVDVAGTAEQLAALTGQDVRVIESRLASRRHFQWIARHVSPDVVERVRAANLPGVQLTQEPARWYPARGATGTIVGFASVDGEGLEGIELSMDAALAGNRARAAAVRDARGRTMLGDGVLAPVPGATVQLTIDSTIQAIADDALALAVRSNQALAGVAVVIDVETGVVLAMASSPNYDPNIGGPERGERNRAVTDEYEIGSIMKVFTIAAALDAGAVRVNQWWDVEKGRWRIADRTIKDTHFDEILSTAGIIKRSSNVGAAKIGLRLGKEKLHDGLLRFGFGTRSGIEVPGERVGKLRDPSKWRDIDVAAISYGYGMTVTPLQMAAGLAAVGNDGVYRAPRIVDRVIHADGSIDVTMPPEPVQAIKPETAAALLPILASVFDGGKQAGTAANVWIPGFICGGKTGTVHKLDPVTRTYSRDRYISSFGGLAPIRDPKLAIVVIVDEPSGGDYYGGKVAGPVFATIASESLRYLGVPGDAPLDPPKAKQAQIAAAQARADRKAERLAAAAPDVAPEAPVPVPPSAPAVSPDDEPAGDGPVLAP